MLYKFLQKLLYPFLKLFYRFKIENFDGFPEGPTILVANHKSNMDAVLLSVAFPEQIYWMGKKELFNNKLFGKVLSALGVFPVDREGNDLRALKQSLKILKTGKVLGIFPEGTRVKSYNPQLAKSGVALMASRGGATIVPVYIEGDYKLFKPVTLHVRTPYKLPSGKRSEEEYMRDTKRLMETIYFGGELNGDYPS